MSDTENGIRTFAIYGDYSGVNIRALALYFSESVEILSWWNHVPLLYCVKARLDASRLRERLEQFFLTNNFIIIQVQTLNQSTIDGRLPEEAWTWFQTPAPPFKHSPDAIPKFGLLPIKS